MAWLDQRGRGLELSLCAGVAACCELVDRIKRLVPASEDFELAEFNGLLGSLGCRAENLAGNDG